MAIGHSHSHSHTSPDRHSKSAALVSLVVGTLLMAVKFWAYNLTGSKAVYSDAMESIVNVVTACVAIFVVFYAAKPADQDHPYGHGKIEFFSAAFEGGLIFFAAGVILFEAVQALLKGHRLAELQSGTYIIIGAGAANFILGRFLIYAGKKNNSITLRASGHHVLSDFWTSVGVAAGLILIQYTGWQWLDSVAAIIVGAYLGYTGIRLLRESMAGLMDEEDVGVLKQLAHIFSKHAPKGVIQLHHVKVIRSGNFHHIDAHVVMPEFWTVDEVHKRITDFEHKVIDNYEYGGEMNFHVDPCRRLYCRNCDLEHCQIRAEKFVERLPVKLADLRSPDEPEEFRLKR